MWTGDNATPHGYQIEHKGDLSMGIDNWTNLFPLWAVFVLTLALSIGAAEAGAVLAGLAIRKKNVQEPEAPLGALVGAMLGLLAFILAFTFGMTGARFDARKQLVLEESNAIGTTYLRAGLLPEKQGLEIRRLLRDYAEVRLGAKDVEIQEVLAKSEEIHVRLWSQAKSLIKEDMDSEVRSLFIASLNEMIDLHQSRQTVGLEFRLPAWVWLSVQFLSVLSMLALGYQTGMTGTRRLLGMPVLALAFSLVIVMIADTDRPDEGFIRVTQQPIADVQKMMQRNSP
jgi:hypothetical protein